MLESRGSCNYCGQIVELQYEIGSTEEANEKATMLCTCSEARNMQKIFEEKAKAVKKREEAIKGSKEAIVNLFGESEDETDDERQPMPEVVVEELKKIAVMVYDLKIQKATFDLPYGVKAKINKSKNGLKIIREDKTGEAVEI